MKKYDKVIFVPDDEYGQYQVKLIKDEAFKEQKYAPQFNSVVCSIEDLREMWDMAKAGPDYPGVFELFLKSKGIQLK